MKKIIPFILLLALVFSFAACKKSPEADADKNGEETLLSAEDVQDTTAAEGETGLAEELPALVLQEQEPAEILVVYFDGRDGVKEAAEAVCAGLGCESFELVPAVPYPENETEKLARADKERAEEQLPALAERFEDMSRYSVVIAVYPEFNGNMPMIIRTFMEDYDFRRVSLVPVCVCSGTEPGEALAQFDALLPFCPVYSGLAVTAEDDITVKIPAWIGSEMK